jgi:hypothetical protein
MRRNGTLVSDVTTDRRSEGAMKPTQRAQPAGVRQLAESK